MNLERLTSLLDIPLLVPAIFGLCATSVLSGTAFVREGQEGLTAFERPARFHAARIARQLEDLTQLFERSSWALETVRDLPPARFQEATQPLLHDFPFIQSVRRHAWSRPLNATPTLIAASVSGEARAPAGAPGEMELVVPDRAHGAGAAAPEREVTVYRLRIDDLMESLVEQASRDAQFTPGLAIYRASAPDPANLVYRSGEARLHAACSGPSLFCPSYQLSRTLEWAGQPWHLSLRAARPGFWQMHLGSTALLVLGAMTTWFGVALLSAHRQRTRRVVELVQLRTQELYSMNQILYADIEQRKQAQQELASTSAKLRSLIDHNDRVKENERKRIARELHDDLGQSLLALKMDMSSMLNGGPVTITHEQLSLVLAQLDGTLAAMRLIINELRPAVLDLGLDAAIEWEASKYSRRSGVPCVLRLLPLPESISDETSTALYRIVQESLTNIMRHANASQVSIDLFSQDDWLFLKISDNGVGMQADSRRKSHSFGLLGMSERIYTLGGAFDVSSPGGGGTILSIAVPLTPPAQSGS